MNWYFAQNNERRGPVAGDVLLSLLAQQAISPTTLVWREGLANWTPLSVVHAELLNEQSAATGSAAAGPTGKCIECGRTFSRTELVDLNGHTVCGGCKPIFLQKLREGVPVGSSLNLWRRKKELVAPLAATLPDRCVKCNADARGQRLERKLYWHHPALYLLIIFPGLLIYAIVAIIVRKSATLQVGICERHRTKRKQALILAWSLFAGAIAAFFTAGALERDDVGVAILLGFGLLIASVLVGMFGARVIYATKIDKQNVFVAGVCPEFLAPLPEWPGS